MTMTVILKTAEMKCFTTFWECFCSLTLWLSNQADVDQVARHVTWRTLVFGFYWHIDSLYRWIISNPVHVENYFFWLVTGYTVVVGLHRSEGKFANKTMVMSDWLRHRCLSCIGQVYPKFTRLPIQQEFLISDLLMSTYWCV